MNKVLEGYGHRGGVETIGRAPWLRVDGVYVMEDLPALPADVIYEPPFDLFRDNFKVRLGDFAVFTGTPGFGKTAFVTDLYCRTALANRLTIAWASFEQRPQSDHRRNLRSWFSQRRVVDMTDAELRIADQWINERHVFIV